jgi:hypothetical protein
MSRYVFLPLILISAAMVSAVGLAARQMIMKVVGGIEGRVLTTRDVQASSILDHLIYNENASSQLKYGTEEFAGQLNRLLIEWMVRDEADVFGVAKVSESEVDETFQSVKSKLKNHPVVKSRWNELNLSESQLREMISRKLRANRFIKYKSNSSFVQVSDDEARDYYNNNRIKFGTTDFDGFKENIKKYLGRKNAEDRLRDWLDILRKKHKVKNLVSGVPIHASDNSSNQ